MDSVRQAQEEMEEIVAYDLDVSRTKACWFPFKKAYERSIMQSEFDNKPKVYVLEGHDEPFSKSFELSLGHNVNSCVHPIESQQFVANTSHVTGDLPLNRSELYDTETTSTVTEEDDLLFGEHAIHQLAEINPNCLSKQFWVEDLLDGKSLSCTDEFVGAGKSVTRLGRSFSTCDSHTTRLDIAGTKSEHADDLSSSRADTPMTPARIEIEYDFTRKSSSSDQDIHPRSIKRVMCGVIKRKEKTRDHGANHTMMSSVSNSTYSLVPKKGPSHSQSSGSAKSQDPNSRSYAINSDMTNERTSGSGGSASQKRATEEVDLDYVKLPKNRILCGAMARRRNKEEPTVIGDEPNDEEKKIDESMLVEPTQAVPESLPTSISLDPPGHFCMRNPQFDAPWVSNMTNNFRARTCAVTNMDWVENRIASVDDSTEPHFYVEVEASAKQLKNVKDLEEIKNEEAIPKGKAPRAVQQARVASLVDDDSAFMERERLVDVFKRLAPKLSSSTKNESAEQTRSNEVKAPVAKSLIASSLMPPRRMRKVRTSIPQPVENINDHAMGNINHDLLNHLPVKAAPGPPSPFHQVNSIVSQGQRHVPGYREGKENIEDRLSSQNTSETAFVERSDATDAAIEQTLAQTRSSASAADRRWPIGVRRIPSGSPWSAWLPEASPSYDSRRSTSSSGSSHFVPRELITVSESPAEQTSRLQTSDTDSVKSTDEGGMRGVTHDFDLARFPSLTSSAWQNVDREQVEITRQPSEVRSEKDPQFRHKKNENFDTAIESNYSLMKHQSSKRTSSREDWAQFNSDDDSESLRRTFDEAVPYEVEYPSAADHESLKHVDHRGMRRMASRSNAAVKKPVKTANRGPSKIWIDDDDSELNTEAFQKLSMDSDEDSIFNGLVDRSPSDYAASPDEKEGQLRVVEPNNEREEIEEDSFSSGNSIAKSRSSTRRAKYPIQSRCQLTRVSTGLSVVSRDEITAYTAAQSVFDEPFNCMDSWLD